MNELDAKTLTSALKAAIRAETEEKSKEYVEIAKLLASTMTLQEVEFCKRAAKDAIQLDRA